LHWREGGRFRLRNVLSICAWGGVLPVSIVALVAAGFTSALLLLFLYPLLFVRTLRWTMRARKLASADAARYSAACVVGKFAEFGGVLRCWRDLLLRRERRIIEYKTA
jgi:hypothetical protein